MLDRAVRAAEARLEVILDHRRIATTANITMIPTRTARRRLRDMGPSVADATPAVKRVVGRIAEVDCLTKV